MKTEQIGRGFNTDLLVHTHQAAAVRLVMSRYISASRTIPVALNDARVLARKVNVISRAFEDQGVDHVADFGRKIKEWERFVLITLRLQNKDVKASVGTFGQQDGLQREGFSGREFDGLSEFSFLLLL